MRRRLEIGLAVVFILAGIVFFRSLKSAEDAIVLEGKGTSSSLLMPEATLRNVTGGKIPYVIEPSFPSRAPRTRTLGVGDVEKIATDVPFKISFDSGARRVTVTISPGKPYSFRYDEKGLIRLYPGSHGREDAADLAPFVPTPNPVVERMLEMAEVGPEDVVYDLGCGDGRMVIAAARKYDARGVGIDIDAHLIEESRENARLAGVDRRTRFICMDAMKARYTGATVLAVYLLPESLDLLRPRFERDLEPGTRVVSHNYRIVGWEDRLVSEDVLEDEDGLKHKVFLYRR